MITIARVDKHVVEGMLNSIPREEIPFVSALALTRTAQSIKEAQIKEIRRAFDRPTPFTQGGLTITRAEKTRLTATVKFKEGARGRSAGQYLQPQVEGGARGMKGIEVLLRARGILPRGKFLTPGQDAVLDSSGNMSRSQLSKLLADLGVRGQGKGSARTFVGNGEAGEPIGIWSRHGRGRVRVLLAFVSQPSYQKRYRFYEVANESVEKEFPVEFAKAFERVTRP